MQRHIIIVAGGKGLRMGSDIPKQFLPVGGKPLLMRTIERFHTFDSEMPITLVLPQQHHDYWQELCHKYRFDIQHTVVHGGEERFFSVKNALVHIPDGVVVGIHDGVRPFASHDTIEQAFAEAEKNGCTVPALPSSDSVRIADGDTSAPFDRRRVFLVQTPQCFRSEIIKEAYRADYNPLFTDDASVVETVLKKEIRITSGNRENIKITTRFDLELANLIYNNQINEE